MGMARALLSSFSMKLRTLASLAVSTALAAAPAATAFADSSPATQTASLTTSATVGHAVSPTISTSDAERYGQREAHDAKTTKVAEFAGGHRVYIIGGSALTLALIIVLIVLLV